MSAVTPPIWYEMPDVRRRSLAASVWIPLRQSEPIETTGSPNTLGYRSEVACTGSLAVFSNYRDTGERLGWGDIGLIHTTGPYAFSDGRYKPAEMFWWNDQDPIGVELVLVHQTSGPHRPEWLLNQDVVMALGLIREGDVWVRPEEGYVQVVRLRRCENGRPVAMEMNAEFLKDYLCARGMALRLAHYRERFELLDDASHLVWASSGSATRAPNERFELRTFEVAAGGGLIGDVAIVKIARTDVDRDEDVPVFGPEADGNTSTEFSTITRRDPAIIRAEGALWREEWVEPAQRSIRVRGDAPLDQCYFAVDAAGHRERATALNDDDIGRWLWFRPEIVNALLSYRDSSLVWYTARTGAIAGSPDNAVHFGLDRSGMINVYACDIARLPIWLQRIWAGNNIVPTGPVAAELLASQMEGEAVSTIAVEDELADSLALLDAAFVRRFGDPLRRHHASHDHILSTIHRFRALDTGGLLALAKDLARISVDSLDEGLLRRQVTPPSGETWRSLKLLQAVIARETGDEIRARSLMSPLFAIFELRHNDAHLPSSAIEQYYENAGIDRTALPIDQAEQLIGALASALAELASLITVPETSG